MNQAFVEDVDSALWHAPWQNTETSRQQLDRALAELNNWRAGTQYPAFHAFLTMIGWCEGLESLLDIGCGTGYYSALLKSARPDAIYAGADVSETAIQAAIPAFPDGAFRVADAENLDFSDKFTVAMLAGVINHTPCPPSAIASAIDVTSKYLMLHRIPCYRDPAHPIRIIVKDAYGVQMAERFFDEESLLGEIPGDLVGRVIRWPRDGGHFLSALYQVK